MTDARNAVGPARYPGAEHDARWRRLVFPAEHRQPDPRERYHLVVIGAGPAGLVTAIAAAGLGAAVALIERHALGGDCLNVGCVPSKALLEFARSERIGPPDFDGAFDRMRRLRASLAAQDSVERFTAAGVDVFHGSARFMDTGVVQVGSARLVTRRTVIATGSHPTLPAIRGLAESRPLTNDTVFDLKRRPKRLAIIGAGAVGCELAEAFVRLGIEIVLIERASRVLPREDPRASDAVARALAALGVELRLAATVSSVERVGTHFCVALAAAGGAEDVVADELLVATGRRASTGELNLAAVGVELDAEGSIIVDRYLRTTNTKIFAAGDVCSSVQLTHGADAHARIAVQNALFAPTATTDGLAVPRCTYTQPEVAQIGPTRTELEQAGTPFDAYTITFDELDRARLGNDDGFAEILTAPRRDRILAATIVARDAGELIAPVAIALALGLGLGDVGKAVLPYPTRSEFLRKTADRWRRTQLTPRRKRLLDAWLRWRA